MGEIEKEQQMASIIQGEIEYYKESYMRFRGELENLIER